MIISSREQMTEVVTGEKRANTKFQHVALHVMVVHGNFTCVICCVDPG